MNLKKCAAGAKKSWQFCFFVDSTTKTEKNAFSKCFSSCKACFPAAYGGGNVFPKIYPNPTFPPGFPPNATFPPKPLSQRAAVFWSKIFGVSILKWPAFQAQTIFFAFFWRAMDVLYHFDPRFLEKYLLFKNTKKRENNLHWNICKLNMSFKLQKTQKLEQKQETGWIRYRE